MAHNKDIQLYIELLTKVLSDEDFVISRWHQNSLRKVLEQYDNGVPDSTAAKMLGLTTEVYNMLLLEALEYLKNKLS